MNPTAALLIIGNEILSGRTQDKNLNHLAKTLGEHGVLLKEARVVVDIEDDIVEAVNALRSKYDYLFTTGGIGPTHDDITSASIAKAFGVPIHRHPEAVRILEDHYEKGELNEARLKMAEIPEGGELIDNPVSSAPGFKMGNVFVFAGVPRIMQAMLDAVKHSLKSGTPVTSLHLVCDLPEGDVAAKLGDIQNQYTQTEIGSYPQFKQGVLSTTLVFRGTDATANQAAYNATKQLIEALGGTFLNIE